MVVDGIARNLRIYDQHVAIKSDPFRIPILVSNLVQLDCATLGELEITPEFQPPPERLVGIEKPDAHHRAAFKPNQLLHHQTGEYHLSHHRVVEARVIALGFAVLETVIYSGEVLQRPVVLLVIVDSGPYE